MTRANTQSLHLNSSGLACALLRDPSSPSHNISNFGEAFDDEHMNCGVLYRPKLSLALFCLLAVILHSWSEPYILKHHKAKAIHDVFYGRVGNCPRRSSIFLTHQLTITKYTYLLSLHNTITIKSNLTTPLFLPGKDHFCLWDWGP